MTPAAMRSAAGHAATRPSGVAPQSVARQRARISPSPAKSVAAPAVPSISFIPAVSDCAFAYNVCRGHSAAGRRSHNPCFGAAVGDFTSRSGKNTRLTQRLSA